MLSKFDVKIGESIRFIDDTNLYEGITFIKLPEIGKVYTVRGYSEKGFYLEEIKNIDIEWIDEKTKEVTSVCEPGFGAWRFEKLKTIKIEIDERLIASIKEKKEIVELETFIGQN
ncbi:MAG: hypothetical protein FJZ67_06890 [Bacteroidetes bacterium]|nr:hypothetical protein [Bacteroidota bacterium]